MTKFEIRERYSFTDEPDEMGRWARILYYNNLTIAWINRLDNSKQIKYSVHCYFPSNRSDVPNESFIVDTYEDALKLAKKEWNKFRKQII
jgi:hypothetical protein